MGKRLTDCGKWTQNKWFWKLPSKYKLFWLYICDLCDPVGVWEENIELASVLLNEDFKEKEILALLADRIKVLNRRNDKWWIVDFINFQYGELKEENINNKPHQSYIALLKKHSLWIDYKKTIQRHKEKEKDKDIDKDQEQDKEKKITEGDFKLIWEKYPSKDGRKIALKCFLGTVKTEEDLKNIQTALTNYLESKKVKEGFIKNGSTWFNNWQDWIEWDEPEKPKFAFLDKPEYADDP